MHSASTPINQSANRSSDTVPLPDILGRSDIETLVSGFYGKVQKDEVIGYFFNDVAKVNWDKHLPKMFDFWENVLFGKGHYSGSPMIAHAKLHEQSPLNAAHFEHWKTLWIATVRELFDGPVAELACQRATSIATVMHMKVCYPGSMIP